MNETRNGPGWSPDGGYFWRKDGKLYWSDGDITDDGGMMRQMPCDDPKSFYSGVENFSEWSDEKRATVRAEAQKKRDEYRAKSDAYIAKIEALCAIAKTKLTPEEYEAVEAYGYHEGTYWP